MYQYVYSPIFNKAKLIEQKTEKATLYLKNLKKEKHSYGDIKKSYDQTFKEYKKITASLIQGDTPAEVGENLQKIVLDFLEKRNIKARNYSSGRPRKKDKYYLISANFNIDVDINQFYELNTHYNSSKYIIKLESLRVDYDRRNPNMLKLNISLSTIFLKRGKNV
jgi:predicted transcriptional regulator